MNLTTDLQARTNKDNTNIISPRPLDISHAASSFNHITAENSKEVGRDGLSETEKDEIEDDETQHPPLKTLIPIMISLLLALFLSALVSITPQPTPLPNLTYTQGPHNHRRSNPRNLQRIPKLRGHRLVRSGLPRLHLHLPAPLRQSLHLLPRKMDDSLHRPSLRARLRRMRHSALFHRLHRRPRNHRHWRCGHSRCCAGCA